jgi:hypothetical protein
MSAPTLDRPPGSQTGTSTGQPRRHNRLALVASALLVVAIAVGASLAIATRPDTSQTPAAAAQQPAAQQPVGQPDQGATTQSPATPQAGQDQASGAATPVLPDGEHPAYISEVDQAHRRIVVDVVQVFDGQAGRDAAIADGMARGQAQYLGVYVRNQNPRLRTLPLAGDLRLDLRGGDCEAPLNHQLTKLAADARAKSGSIHTYYFVLTVAGGQVHKIQERLAINAC